MSRFPKAGHVTLVCIIALFLTATGNIRFFQETEAVYPLAEEAAFLTSAAIVLACVMALVTSVFSFFLPIRVVGTVLFLLAAAAGHFSDAMGIAIDTEMIRNALGTDMDEAGDLITTAFAVRFLLLGVLPSALLWLVPLRPAGLLRRQTRLVAAAAASLVVAVAVMAPFSDTYASYFREHKPLRYYSNPTYPIYSAGKFALTQGAENTAGHLVETRLTDAVIPTEDEAHDLVILVVGETARADHFGLNGYARQTTPKLAARGGHCLFQRHALLRDVHGHFGPLPVLPRPARVLRYRQRRLDREYGRRPGPRRRHRAVAG